MAPNSVERQDSVGTQLERVQGLLTQRAQSRAKAQLGPTASPRGAPSPLTEIQEALYNLCEPGDNGAYNVPWAVALDGELDEHRLANAWTLIQSRHTYLRARIRTETGSPYADIAEETRPLLCHSAANATEAENLVNHLSNTPFEITDGPLIDLHLVRVTPTSHYLLLLGHHIIIDGWSQAIITRELAQAYAGKQYEDRNSIDFSEYARWTRRPSTQDRIDRSLEYWRTKLSGLQHLDFPTSYARQHGHTSARPGALHHGELNATAYHILTELCANAGIPVFSGISAVFVAVLRRYCQQDDIALGSVMAGRSLTDNLDDTVGMFANSVLMRFQVRAEQTFRELLETAGSEIADLLEHEVVPFARVVAAAGEPPMPGMNPLFQISLTLQNGSTQGTGALHDLKVTPLYLDSTTARFDLAFQVHEPNPHDETARVWVEYSTDLFTKERIQDLVRHVNMALVQFTQDPDMALEQLELLSDDERKELIQLSSGPTRVRKDSGTRAENLIQRVAQDATSAASIAIQFGDYSLTYTELLSRASAASREISKVSGPGDVVGLGLSNRLDLIVAQLATWISGAAWTVLDSTYPTARLEEILAQTQCTAVIVDNQSADAIRRPRFPISVINRDSLDGHADTLAATEHSIDSPAYVIFTSGSTGRPKGVQVSHRALTNFLLNARELFDVTQNDRFLMFASPSFDVSIFDVFVPLIAGASSHGAERDRLADPAELVDFCNAMRITLGDIPPAVLRHVDPHAVPTLRAVFVGLEPYPASLPARWIAAGRTFNNGYGPTESTVACINHVCSAADEGEMPPIGLPMPNHKAFVMGDKNRLQPIGVPGELLICGTGLADGYISNDALTKEAFASIDVAGTSERSYHTGDLVKWNDLRQLVFVGRRDTQVKIRGFRIELGEVESLLLNDGHISSAVARVVTGPDDEPMLIAYITSRAPIDPQRLREYMLEHVPPYMVPSDFVQIDSMPLNQNGKIDEKRLPMPFAHTAPADSELLTGSESSIAALCADVFNADISLFRPSTNLFTVGANSLNMARLARRIGAKFDVELRVYDVMRAPTPRGISQLVDRIRTGGSAREAFLPPSWMVPLTPVSPSRENLFIVHASGGTAFPFQELAQQLSGTVNCIGIEAVGLHGQDPHDDLDSMASAYAEAIRGIQPRGPYSLAAWSIGGAITTRIVSYLASVGSSVRSLIFIDCVPPSAIGTRATDELLGDFVRDTLSLLDVHPGPNGLANVPSRFETVTAAVDYLVQSGVVDEADLQQAAQRARTFLATVRLGLQAHDDGISVPTLLLSASSSSDGSAWSEILTDTLTMEVDANHYSILKSPAVEQVAAAAQRHIKEHR